MVNFVEWILIVISTILFYKSLRNIMGYISVTIADYVMLVIYIFNCIPVLLDKMIGIPYYDPWFQYFELALNNKLISLVYTIYVLSTMICLYLYIKYRKASNVSKSFPNNIYFKNNSLIFNNKILPVVIFLPYISIIISGNLRKYFKYGSTSVRGLDDSFYQFNSSLVLISIFAFCCLFFAKDRSRNEYIVLLVYALSISWIDGKRYILVTLIVIFLFFYLNSITRTSKKLPLKRIFVVITIAFLTFNFIYALYIKPIATTSFDSLYKTYRIDFGRDDVTKFVLYREIILDDPILDQRGESFISTLLMFIPREVWPSKPYPHYRYLTAELFDTTIFNIPAGMTPSLYEMSIANFGVLFGIIMTILIIIFGCSWADNCKSIPRKALYLLLIIGSLTQSMDALMVLMIIAPMSAVSSLIKRNLQRKVP
jgi:hypothetical protein